ncbi:hypothetical protein BOTBODRAFT_41364 [Botryobasidium botryosum FD-172 SS1]|uniref:Arrestin-like N-terminal domain-containing protein n=1 Tax=Botryobasidium botryosum (strain FD-172 SS1) TaxID=930990 RepID=A0A067N8M3_BOTB1|nr:hypothetical protein BOTBODRAFT_41364 [Botryobasidium botryosum FD-172 SS1]
MAMTLSLAIPKSRQPSAVPAHLDLSPVDTNIASPAYTDALSVWDNRPATTDPDEFTYKSKHLVLNLGARQWPTDGKVEGWITIKNVQHTKLVTVRVEGEVLTTINERGLPVAHTRLAFLSLSKTIYNARDSSASSGSPIPFSFVLPMSTQQGTSRLPPSCSLFLPGASAEVRYRVKVEMVRKGLRFNQSIKTKILYLPKTTSPRPKYLAPPPEDPDAELRSPGYEESTQWTIVDVPPTYPNTKGPTNKTPVSAQLLLPYPTIYPAHRPIPIVVTLTSPSPVLLALLSNITLQLVVTTKMCTRGNTCARERVIGTGRVTASEEHGLKLFRGAVSGGNEGGEMSWKIDGYAEVKYAIRLIIRPPPEARSLDGALPYFTHTQTIQLTTHEQESEGAESEAEAEVTPALGLLGPAYIRRASGSLYTANTRSSTRPSPV